MSSSPCPTRILVVEFKVGATTFEGAAIEQVHDYALDLKNFHLGSHDAPIVPVLYATNAPLLSRFGLSWFPDRVAEPLKIGEGELGELVLEIASANTGVRIDFETWLGAGYKPTPTIVEAAQALFQHHGVQEITRSDAGARKPWSSIGPGYVGMLISGVAQEIGEASISREHAGSAFARQKRKIFYETLIE